MPMPVSRTVNVTKPRVALAVDVDAAAAVGVLDGVLDQVRQDLTQARAVADDMQVVRHAPTCSAMALSSASSA